LPSIVGGMSQKAYARQPAAEFPFVSLLCLTIVGSYAEGKVTIITLLDSHYPQRFSSKSFKIVAATRSRIIVSTIRYKKPFMDY